MKHWLFCCLLALVFGIAPINAQAEVLLPDLLRVQIIADSDEPEDQQIKLRIRDEVLPMIQEIVKGSSDSDEAFRLARLYKSKWEGVAHQVLSEYCIEQSARAEIGEMSFPDRIADGILVPGGTYRTIRITLGSGDGHNWWGVLYPDLCRLNRYEQDDIRIPFYSHTLAFLRKLFGGGWA